MNEFDLRRVQNYPIYPRDWKTYSDKGFVNIYNGSQVGTNWTCFIKKITNYSVLTRLVVNQINF